MRRVSVRAIALHEGKLLCVRLCNYNEMASVEGEWWCLPGGTVEEGEVLEETLVREMVEETGIAPQIGKLLYVHQFIFKEKEHLEFFFHIKNSTDYLSVDLESTTHGLEEIEEIDFVDTRTTVILPKFLSHESLEAQIALDQPTKFISFEER